MNPEPVLYESHMHTPLCGHAKGDPTEYAAVAYQRGFKGINVTCHNPPVDGWCPRVRMAEDQFDDYTALIEATRQEWNGRLDVRMGMEFDYAPHMEEGIARQQAWAPFNHRLAGIHPQLEDYRERFYTGDDLAYQRTYFDHLGQAAESGLFDTLAHPDLIKNEVVATWDPLLVWEDILNMLDRVAASGVAMELNTSGLNKRIREMNPGREILAEMNQRAIPVVIGADAHAPQRAGIDYDRALLTLQEVGFTNVNIFLDGQRVEIPIITALESLTPVQV